MTSPSPGGLALALYPFLPPCPVTNLTVARNSFSEGGPRLEAGWNPTLHPADFLATPSRKSAAPHHVAGRFGLCTAEREWTRKCNLKRIASTKQVSWPRSSCTPIHARRITAATAVAVESFVGQTFILARLSIIGADSRQVTS